MATDLDSAVELLQKEEVRVQNLSKSYEKLRKSRDEALTQGNLTKAEKLDDILSDINRELKTHEEALSSAKTAAEGLEKEEQASFSEERKQAIDKINDAIGNGTRKAFEIVSKVVASSVQNNTAYFNSLNKIVGLQGQLGEFGNTLRQVSSGLATKSDLADFFGSTGSLMAGASAMEANVKNAKTLITALGDANTAAQTFQQIQLLSAKQQAAALSYYEKQAKAIENSATGQIISIKNLVSESVDSLGQTLLYSVKPIIEFVAEVANAFKIVSGFGNLSDQTQAAADAAKTMTDEEKEALDTLNMIQRLQATGFTSTLDEVHEIGQVYIEDEEEQADKVVESETKKQDAMLKTSETATKIAESLYTVIQIATEVGDTFAQIWSTVGVGIVKFAANILKVVSATIQWADKAGILKAILIATLPVLGSLKGAQMALAAAQAIVAVTKVAASGPLAPVTATAVIAGVGATVGALAGLGIGIAGAVGAGSTPSYSSNYYTGTANETKAEVAVYLDGKKVNDELANSKFFDEEVKIS